MNMAPFKVQVTSTWSAVSWTSQPTLTAKHTPQAQHDPCAWPQWPGVSHILASVEMVTVVGGRAMVNCPSSSCRVNETLYPPAPPNSDSARVSGSVPVPEPVHWGRNHRVYTARYS